MHTCIEIIRSFQNVSISCDIISSQIQIIHCSIGRLCSELNFRKSVFFGRGTKTTILCYFLGFTYHWMRFGRRAEEYNSMPTLCILYKRYACSMCTRSKAVRARYDYIIRIPQNGIF